MKVMKAKGVPAAAAMKAMKSKKVSTTPSPMKAMRFARSTPRKHMAASDAHAKIDLIGFNLKMLAKTKQRSLLISAGSPEDKEYLLDVCKKLTEIGVRLYATPGTHQFLAKNGVESDATSWNKSNIGTLIKDGKLDFVVNILTGDKD